MVFCSILNPKLSITLVADPPVKKKQKSKVLTPTREMFSYPYWLEFFCLVKKIFIHTPTEILMYVSLVKNSKLIFFTDIAGCTMYIYWMIVEYGNKSLQECLKEIENERKRKREWERELAHVWEWERSSDIVIFTFFARKKEVSVQLGSVCHELTSLL